jgi:hypothetical protein
VKQGASLAQYIGMGMRNASACVTHVCGTHAGAVLLLTMELQAAVLNGVCHDEGHLVNHSAISNCEAVWLLAAASKTRGREFGGSDALLLVPVGP